MPEKAKTESSLAARRGGVLLGPVKSSRCIGKKTSSSSPPTKRKSSTPITQPATPTAFKGVRMRAWGKWVTEIRDPETRNRIWLGSFSTPEMAARAYDAAVVCLKGESAIASLNFPDSPPQIPPESSKSPKDIQAVAAAAATSSVPAAKPLCIPLPTLPSPSPEASAASLYPYASLDLLASLYPSAFTSDDSLNPSAWTSSDHQGIKNHLSALTSDESLNTSAWTSNDHQGIKNHPSALTSDESLIPSAWTSNDHQGIKNHPSALTSDDSLNPSAWTSDDHQGIVAEVKNSMTFAFPAPNPAQMSLAAEEVRAVENCWTNAFAGEPGEPVDPTQWYGKEPEAVDAIAPYDLEPSSFEMEYSFNLVAELWPQ